MLLTRTGYFHRYLVLALNDVGNIIHIKKNFNFWAKTIYLDLIILKLINFNYLIFRLDN